MTVLSARNYGLSTRFDDLLLSGLGRNRTYRVNDDRFTGGCLTLRRLALSRSAGNRTQCTTALETVASTNRLHSYAGLSPGYCYAVFFGINPETSSATEGGLLPLTR